MQKIIKCPICGYEQIVYMEPNKKQYTDNTNCPNCNSRHVLNISYTK